MSDTNKNYDIDDLVNSLLKEKQGGAPMETPAVDVEKQSLPSQNLLDALPEVEEVEQTPASLPNSDVIDENAEATKHGIMAEDTLLPRPTTDDVIDDEKASKSKPVEEKAESEAPPKKRKKLFKRKIEDTATIERSWADWGLTPIGHYRANASAQEPEADLPVKTEPAEKVSVAAAKTVDEETPANHVDEFPAVTAVSDTITMQVVLPSGVALPRSDEHTRVMPVLDDKLDFPDEPIEPEPVVVADDNQLPDQLSLEEMVRVEDIEPVEGEVAEEDELDPEERLQLTREEKIREFTLDGDEEENEPDEESVDESDEGIEDYTGYQDTETVAAELKYRCRVSLLSLLFTGTIQFALLVITLLTVKLEQPPMTPTAYLMITLFGLLFMMLFNYSTITRGLSGLFSLRANNDTAPALAAAVGLVDVGLHLLNPETFLPFWTPLIGLVLTLSAAGHYAHEVCVRRNFAFVSYPGDKYAAAVIEDESALQEIGRRAVSEGDATVAYFRRTGFLSEYLTNAYDDDGGDDWSRWMTPVSFGLSLLLSCLSLMSEHVSGVMSWMSVFTGMICLSMPITMLAVHLPLSRCCRRMLSNGGFLVGWKAVRRFGSPDALAVDIADLYPDESMRLHGIKTFSGTHIDEAILAAASLVVRAGGPLAMIFRRIIENRENLLYDVDSLVYEQGMGLSGWVDGRRVFVGNSRLLQNHGVDVPSADYEARYAKEDRRLVYVSIAGQLSAMFVVTYLPDPEIQASLQELCRSRVTLLVRSCDPNITTSDLCESFELDEYYVDVLPASAGRMYVQLTEQTEESLPALMASNGHILGASRVLSVCRALQAKVRIALVVQTVFALLGLVLCLTWTMKGVLTGMLFRALLLLLGSLFFSWFIPIFRRT